MDPVKAKIRERDQIRRVYKRHEASAASAIDVEFLKEKVDQLNILNKEIQQKMLNDVDFDQDAYEKECEECDKLRLAWLKLRSKLQVKEEQASPAVRHHLNLPKLEIRKFDDNPKTWLAFWGQYRKIHEEPTMDAETKFQYLIQAMKEGTKARTLVESYPPNEANYDKVISTLKQRFAQTNTLIEIYVRELLKLVNCKNSIALDRLYDEIVTNLQILQSLGISNEKYECILLPMIESALPESTLLSWSKVPHIGEKSRLDNLLSFLQTEVEAERRVQLAKSEFLCSPKATVPTAACLVSEQVKGKPSSGVTYEKVNKETCYFCDKPHSCLECGKASSFKLEEKKELIKKQGGCYICLKKGHLAKNCRVFVKCLCCTKRHAVVLCPKLHEPTNSTPVTEEEVSNNFSNHNNNTLSQTVIVKLQHKNKEMNVRALLDSGSQRTYINTDVTEQLGLEVAGMESLGHTLFGGVKKDVKTHRLIRFQVSDLNNTYQTTMHGLESDVLCGNLPKINDPSVIQKLKSKNINLTDCKEEISDISILIGSDYIGTILDTGMVHVTDSLVALKTKLGWTIQGPTQGVYNTLVTSLYSSSAPENDLELMWNIETLGIKDPYEKESERTEEVMLKHFEDNITEKEDGRYEVNLIWKNEQPSLDSNFKQTESRLMSTTRKLEQSGNLESYHEVFKDWEKEGIIEKVLIDNRNEGHYVAHHAVIKLESSTIKIRPVFDASARDWNGNSLNACIEKCPNMIEDIPKLLIRFRAKAFGVISDIRKAFLQISLAQADRKYLKLLWWDDPMKKERKLLTYQHARVPFGVACCPFLLAATIDHHLKKNESETAKILREAFYVDNCVTSFDTEEQVHGFKEEATKIMERGKFELRDWISNLNKEKESVSVLGIQWNVLEDGLYSNIKPKAVPNKISKRDLLSVTQQIFDPLGFFSPVMLVPKLIIQQAWIQKTGWDEEIPVELEKEYKEWVSIIDKIESCRVPRRLTDGPLEECDISVHVFCDASKAAFLRSEFQGRVSVRLIIAKSRVVPIKREMTLPRLELMGAVIASRLYNQVVLSGLLDNCKNYKVYCWTDSSVVWAWLKRSHCWKAFVNNRVDEICKNTNREDWHHLPGSFNPADLPSRGCSATMLLECKWWNGPEWLYLEKEHWPKSDISKRMVDEDIVMKKQKKVTAVNINIDTETFSEKLLHFSKYSKIIKLVARILRLSPTTRRNFNTRSTHITCEEYKNAENVVIKLIQKESYSDKNNINKKLITIQEDGIIKVKTRLEYSGEEKDFIFPILLPGNNEIVQRMIQEKHRRLNHAGTQTLMSSLRNTYWITSVRKLVKNTISRCITCKKEKAKHYVVPEPPLPADRILSTAPFEVTGIDLAGPLILKNNEKCWIVLFTCAVYRAIHLELVDSLSTSSFLMTLRRFIARRGRPRTIYTDNGTNFVGAANLLSEVNWQEVEEATNPDHIVWKFSVPAAPWWGGWWERIIRVVKDMLRRILGKASVDWIELSTILCDCESVINSRPLTYVEMGSVKPLTPMMFLQSLPSGETPDLDAIDEESMQVRHHYLQQLRTQFRTRFKSEYLSLLISKGHQNRKEPIVGEVVLVETEGKRQQWPLGIIQETFIGKDGFTRSAKVRTAVGIKVRPYQRLYPLELSTVSQDWLENIPAPSMAADIDSPTQRIDLQSYTAPSPSAPTSERYSRLGRAIRLPQRFLY